MRIEKKYFEAILFVIIVVICTIVTIPFPSRWRTNEKELINSKVDTMKVLKVNFFEDSVLLRKPSSFLSERMIKSDEYAALARKMLVTVTAPENDGVGIAGPQVGILRRVVAVQRFDKAGEPFEVYPNISIIRKGGECQAGPEGCLSVPDMRGDVKRYYDIDIKYTSPRTLKDTVESVSGFTAVIFQHECDHLDGVLYTDYL